MNNKETLGAHNDIRENNRSQDILEMWEKKRRQSGPSEEKVYLKLIWSKYHLSLCLPLVFYFSFF